MLQMVAACHNSSNLPGLQGIEDSRTDRLLFRQRLAAIHEEDKYILVYIDQNGIAVRGKQPLQFGG